MELAQLSGLPAFLGALAPLAVLGGFLWLCFRTESRHVLMYRIWRLLHGSQSIHDPEVNAYIEEQSSLMSFRFLTGVNVKSLANARRLIQWARFHDIELQAIGWCGEYFDPDLRQVRTQKLPSAWVQSLKFGALVLVWVLFFASSLGIANDRAGYQFKSSGHWFYVRGEAATSLWPFKSESLKKSDCEKDSSANALRTSFTESEVGSLCEMLASPEMGETVKKTVFNQRVTFALLLLALAVAAWFIFWECMKGPIAKKLSRRHLNPDMAGGQGELKFDEN
jgi:hypothetical protein